MRARHSVNLVASVVSFLACGAAAAQLSQYRQYEPVVIEGRLFPQWSGNVPIGNLNLYVYSGGAFVAIPFQIDKRRLIHVNYNLKCSTTTEF